MQYHILIKTPPDGGYTGQSLELSGVISDGETLDELMVEAINLLREIW